MTIDSEEVREMEEVEEVRGTVEVEESEDSPDTSTRSPLLHPKPMVFGWSFDFSLRLNQSSDLGLSRRFQVRPDSAHLSSPIQSIPGAGLENRIP